MIFDRGSRWRDGSAALRSVRAAEARRLGYSLPELLLVLGVLALIAGLTLPALRGPLDKSRLRGAARQMQRALARTRSLAIRSGREHWLVYEIGGRTWRIAARPEPRAQDPLSSAAATLPADMGQGDEVIREGELSRGVRFVDAFAGDLTDDVGLDNVKLLNELASDGGRAIRWSDPIRFKPNGYGADTVIQIQGTRDFTTRIRLRGLTGTTTTVTSRRSSTDSEPSLLDSVMHTSTEPRQ